MACPQPDVDFLRLSRPLLEAVVAADLSRSQYKVLLAILRCSYGFGESTTGSRCGYGALVKMTGVARSGVAVALAGLQKAGCVALVQRGHAGQVSNEYAVCKDYDRWGCLPEGWAPRWTGPANRTSPAGATGSSPAGRTQESRRRGENKNAPLPPAGGGVEVLALPLPIEALGPEAFEEELRRRWPAESFRAVERGGRRTKLGAWWRRSTSEEREAVLRHTEEHAARSRLGFLLALLPETGQPRLGGLTRREAAQERVAAFRAVGRTPPPPDEAEDPPWVDVRRLPGEALSATGYLDGYPAAEHDGSRWVLMGFGAGAYWREVEAP